MFLPNRLLLRRLLPLSSCQNFLPSFLLRNCVVLDQSAPRMAGLLFFQDELIPQLRDELNFKNVACTALKRYKMHRYGSLFGLVCAPVSHFPSFHLGSRRENLNAQVMMRQNPPRRRNTIIIDECTEVGPLN